MRSFWAKSGQKRRSQRAKPQFSKLFYNGDEKTGHILRFLCRSSRNHPKGAPLNWTVADFKTTVLEGFYELCKSLEISVRHIGKVYAQRFLRPSVIRAQINRVWNLSPPFPPRSSTTRLPWISTKFPAQKYSLRNVEGTRRTTSSWHTANVPEGDKEFAEKMGPVFFHWACREIQF